MHCKSGMSRSSAFAIAHMMMAPAAEVVPLLIPPEARGGHMSGASAGSSFNLPALASARGQGGAGGSSGGGLMMSGMPRGKDPPSSTRGIGPFGLGTFVTTTSGACGSSSGGHAGTGSGLGLGVSLVPGGLQIGSPHQVAGGGSCVGGSLFPTPSSHATTRTTGIGAETTCTGTCTNQFDTPTSIASEFPQQHQQQQGAPSPPLFGVGLPLTPILEGGAAGAASSSDAAASSIGATPGGTAGEGRAEGTPAAVISTTTTSAHGGAGGAGAGGASPALAAICSTVAQCTVTPPSSIPSSPASALATGAMPAPVGPYQQQQQQQHHVAPSSRSAPQPPSSPFAPHLQSFHPRHQHLHRGIGIGFGASATAVQSAAAAAAAAPPPYPHAHLTLKDCIAYIRERRPRASPNPGFMRQLIALEASLHHGETTIDLEGYSRDRFGDVRSFCKGEIHPAMAYAGEGSTGTCEEETCTPATPHQPPLYGMQGMGICVGVQAAGPGGGFGYASPPIAMRDGGGSSGGTGAAGAGAGTDAGYASPGESAAKGIGQLRLDSVLGAGTAATSTSGLIGFGGGGGVGAEPTFIPVPRVRSPLALGHGTTSGRFAPSASGQAGGAGSGSAAAPDSAAASAMMLSTSSLTASFSPSTARPALATSRAHILISRRPYLGSGMARSPVAGGAGGLAAGAVAPGPATEVRLSGSRRGRAFWAEQHEQDKQQQQQHALPHTDSNHTLEHDSSGLASGSTVHTGISDSAGAATGGGGGDGSPALGHFPHSSSSSATAGTGEGSWPAADRHHMQAEGSST